MPGAVRSGAVPRRKGALGGGVEELVEGGPADLQVVEDDDGADGADERRAARPGLGAVQRGAVERRVGEVSARRSAAVRRWPLRRIDAVGGEVGAVGGDGVQEQPGAAGAGRGRRAGRCGRGRAGRTRAARCVLAALQQGERRAARGPGGTGGAAARAAVGALGGGAAGRVRPGLLEPGGQGSTSLPSTGLTVSRRSPTVSWTIRTCFGVGWPKSALPTRGTAGAGRRSRQRRRSVARTLPAPGVSGPSISPQTRRARLPLRPHTPRCRFRSGVCLGWVSWGRRPNPARPSHSIHARAGCHAVRDVTFR
ncbi:hypothetical protein SMICM17S_09084 [Streptomyces microflavus]